MENAECIVLKNEVDYSKEVCLFVTHSVDCTTKPHVAHHVRCLVNEGFQVVLIFNTDKMSLARRALAFTDPRGIIVRRNIGFDFGAWADALRISPDLWECQRLLLVNDSVIGPAKNAIELFQRLRRIPADLVGLIESYEHVRHFQSFFLMLNKPALQNFGVRQFWHGVVNLETKTEVIKAYELGFTEHCRRCGLVTKAVFQQSLTTNRVRRTNPTILYWRQLMSVGFPYIKIELVRDRLSSQSLQELKLLARDQALNPFIDSYASMRAAVKR